jgi:hypothetical protein
LITAIKIITLSASLILKGDKVRCLNCEAVCNSMFPIKTEDVLVVKACYVDCAYITFQDGPQRVWFPARHFEKIQDEI